MKLSTRLALFLAILISPSFAFADHISQETAKEVAVNFYIQQNPEADNNKTVVSLIEVKTLNNQNLLYIFDINAEGFVIVAGWDGVVPIAGYSNSGSFPNDTEDLPPALISMLDYYEQQIAFAVAEDLEPTPEISAKWDELVSPVTNPGGSRSVSPLISTNWNQSCYYNELCPEDNNAPNGYCNHVPVGCVALAMAQVMKYWDYPATGNGSHSYYASPYGMQSADFGSTTYEWENMPNSINSSNLAVATLLYHCAVSVDMQFGPNGSGASTWDALTALENYFNYDPEAQFYYKSSFPEDTWEEMLREELDQGRPIIYRGSGTGGHAWVCDGYSADDYFHMNWGWGGYANGYFYLSNLNPSGMNFSNNQAAIMHIIPAEANVEPPTNLEAQVDDNDIMLSWDEPIIPQWIYWCNGSTGGVLSLMGGGSYNAAARWEPEHIEEFDGLYITKVSVYLGTNLADYEIKIWTGENAANLILTQPVTSMIPYSWNIIELNQAIQIDASNELFVGVGVLDQPDGEGSLGHDNGPGVTGLGDLISFDGSNWSTLSGFGMNFNWNIQAYVNTSPDGKDLQVGTLVKEPIKNSNTNQIISSPVKPGTQNASPPSRDILGYNIYRNDLKINESIVSEQFYTDEDVQPGTHTYYVTSVYNAGESAPSNTVTVTSGIITQTLQLETGWNSLSSSIVPLNPEMESMCSSVMGNMIIIQNLNGVYYPGMNINTIGNWDVESGYLIKVDQACNLAFDGLPSSSKTLTLNSGWNLIPVISACEVNTAELFNQIANYITIVKDAAGTGVYWPEKDINTLPVLKPGQAYLVKITSSGSITFPECE